MKRFEEFIMLVDKAIVVCESDASWKTKYELIFSPEISQAIYKTNISIDNYYDPDTSYLEDVVAFVSAVKEKADEIKLALSRGDMDV